MQIEITPLIETDMFLFSHSVAEGGHDAGRQTWQAANDENSQLLDTPEKLEAMRDFALSSGGWNREEVDAWTPEEVNALFMQWVAGDCRECPAKLEGITFEQREGEGWFYNEEETPDMETGPFDSRSEAYDQATGSRPPRADSLEEIDWDEYESQVTAGRISGNLYRADAGGIWFYLQW